MTLTTDELRQIVETDHVQCGDAAAMARELIANREAKPVGEIHTVAESRQPGVNIHMFNSEKIIPNGTKLYTAPPAPAVPDEATAENVEALSGYVSTYKMTESERDIAAEVWNACRAAMLNHVGDANEKAAEKCECSSIDYCENCLRAMLDQPVSSGYKLPDGWISCSERMPPYGKYLVMHEFGRPGGSLSHAVATYMEFDKNPPNKEIVKDWVCGVKGVHNITHWMPLPAAPEGGK